MDLKKMIILGAVIIVALFLTSTLGKKTSPPAPVNAVSTSLTAPAASIAGPEEHAPEAAPESGPSQDHSEPAKEPTAYRDILVQ